MHPIEHLRYVARAHGADPVEVAMGAADAIAGISRDPAAALVAARRLVEHHPTNAPLWSVCAHAVTSMDPYRDVDDLARRIANDPTATNLVDALDAILHPLARAKLFAAMNERHLAAEAG